MNAKWILNRHSMLVGLLGATVLFGSPLSAQADQGKWWNPERGSKRSAGREQAAPPRQTRQNTQYGPNRGQNSYRGQSDYRGQSSYRGRTGYDGHGGNYRPPAWHNRGAYRQGPRYYRPWYGHRLYRERVWLRSGYGHYGQPVYGWRYYSPPYYYYPRHIVYVSPVRFYVSVGAVIGGVHVHGSYHDADDVYGCNFCDAQFSSYHAYENHVGHCRYAPDGYRVEVRDSNQDQWDDEQVQDDRGWDRESGD